MSTATQINYVLPHGAHHPSFDKRWDGIFRPYSEEQVKRLRAHHRPVIIGPAVLRPEKRRALPAQQATEQIFLLIIYIGNQEATGQRGERHGGVPSGGAGCRVADENRYPRSVAR